MLTLKNPFAKSPAEAAYDRQKETQLRSGRTAKTVKQCTEDLAALRQEAARVRQQLGEQEVDGLDTAETLAALRRIEEHILTAEAVLTVKKQKDEQAQRDRQQAETKANREALRELLIALADVARKADTQMLAMGRTAAEAHRIIQRIHALGVGELNSRLMTVVGWFRIRLLDSCEQMPTCWTGQDLYGKRESWASHVPSPDEADRLVK